MTKVQIAIIVIAVVFILAGATILFIAPSKSEIDDKLVDRTRMAKKAVWQFRK